MSKKVNTQLFDIEIQYDVFVDFLLFLTFMWSSSTLFVTPFWGMICYLVLRSTASFIRIRRCGDTPKMRALRKIKSYDVFTSTTLYSSMAFLLGGMLYMCYLTFTRINSSYSTYLYMLIWIGSVMVIFVFFQWLLQKRGLGLRVSTFVLGAAIWIIGSILLYRSTEIIKIIIYTMFWALGIASTNAVVKQMDKDFKLVTRLAGKKISDEELRLNEEMVHSVAIITANIVTILILLIWYFVIVGYQRDEVPKLFKNIMVQIPTILMFVSVVFALKQPMDERSREKLYDFYAGHIRNARTRANLRKMFIHKHRVRAGIKIVIWFLKPFFRLEVSGKENLDKKNFPSIFICNHGVWSGPMAAAMYLPTYFRPWVHNVMLDRDKAASDMFRTFFHRLPLMTDKMRRGLAYFVAGPVTWALNAFNPIAVERSSNRRLLETFNDTIDALLESDNVLIFPERPVNISNEDANAFLQNMGKLGDLATGFASIGKLYYQKSGKCIWFYPMYINRKERIFKIGKPIVYNPGNNPHDEKQRISDELKNAIDVLSAGMEQKRTPTPETKPETQTGANE